ncbi:hypothetical protein EDD15DRAFT_2202666 [Pisolithus albus]|nr:hypothetical protein EDD15DRAFT_2202666 [Pisolithus albus]
MTVKLDRPSQMPVAQKRVGFEREKKRWGRNLLRLRENIVSDYGTDRALQTLYNSDRSESHKIDTLLSAQGHLEFRRREEFTECCDWWMQNVGETVGMHLVHAKSVGCSLRETVGYPVAIHKSQADIVIRMV